MSSSSGSNSNVHKLEPLCSRAKQIPNEFDFSQANVTSNTNNAIDIILETVNMIDKLVIAKSRMSVINTFNSYHVDNSKYAVRGKLYSALDVLRAMTPNHGNRMHMNQLPDDCLLTIFTKNFTMQKMVGSFRRVCHRWKSVIEGSVCAPKRSLKLFGGRDDVWQYGKKLMDSNMYADKQLQLGHPDHALVLFSWALNQDVQFFQTLRIIFPNVQHLVIGVGNVSSSNHCLLSRFMALFPGLVRLSVFFKWNSKEDSPTTKYPELCEYFFQFIGSMKSLKHLDLLGDSMLGCDKIAEHLPNVLPQLEHMSMENSKYGDTGSILAKLGSNLKSLRLDQFSNFQETIQSSISAELAANISELRVSKVTNLQTVEFVCQTFQHLNKLELGFEYSDDEEVLPTFPLDSHLITILNSHPQIDSISLENLQINLNSFTPSTFPPSTVKSLHLSNLSHNQTLSDGVELIQTLASIFPHIQQLDYQFGVPKSLRAFDYNTCKIDDKYVRSHFAHLRDCRVYYRHCVNEYIRRFGYGCDCSDAIRRDDDKFKSFKAFERQLGNREWDESDDDEDE